jgi:hypothetical protein
MLPLVPTNDERAKEWDMPSRAQALKDFYGGPVWKAHREAANATMIDSDNVLLLHPATPTSGFSLGNKERPRVGASEARSELIVATIYYNDAFAFVKATTIFARRNRHRFDPPCSVFSSKLIFTS